MSLINFASRSQIATTSRRPTAWLKYILIIYAVAFGIFAFAAATAPVSGNAALILFSAVAGGLTAVSVCFVLSDVDTHHRPLVGLIVIGVAVDLMCNFIGLQWEAASVAGKVITSVSKGFGNLGVLGMATGAGLLVARGLREPRYLIMAAVVGAITDIFSVYAGPTKHIVKTSMFPYVSYHWGLIGSGGVFPCVGMGDFIFLVLYFAGVRKFGLSQKRTFLAMGAAFIVGFLSTLISPHGVPALPFMSFALLAVNLGSLKKQI